MSFSGWARCIHLLPDCESVALDKRQQKKPASKKTVKEGPSSLEGGQGMDEKEPLDRDVAQEADDSLSA